MLKTVSSGSSGEE